MSIHPVYNFSYSPAVQSLMPMIYAAWADRVLTPSEVRILRIEADALDFLTADDKALLSDWSNPMRPPSPYLFKYWEIELRRAADEYSQESELKISLVDLGLFMAGNSSKRLPEDSRRIDWARSDIRTQLEAFEEALQQIGLDTYYSIFPEIGHRRQIAQEKETTSFETEDLTSLLDDQYGDLRRRVKTLLCDPVFRYRNLRIKEDYRQQVLEWCKYLAEQGLGAYSYPVEYGGKNDMGQYAAVFETLGYHDLSLTIKFGVQFGLFGGSVLWLGTKRHHDRYMEAIGTMELPGCFAMTETGHGSNVRGLETTATYDPDTDEFIIDSPHRAAGKEYIGNALHGRMASVFAQLIVDGENHGVHAILVPLRDEAGNELPGIEVQDNGYKLGLNGVDNGRIWFDQVRVPRVNLLNRFGDVDENGQYQSPIENPSRRFFTMLGTLVGGRVCVPRAGLSAAKSALTIAVRYALKRRQFAPTFTEPETLLLDYPSHQRRLMPLLAKSYALDFALTYLTTRYVNRSEEDIREIETLAAGLKSYATWFTTECIQECREACGGKGYLAENRFAALKADTDIFTTFEGDNTVLMQLVAKGVLSEFRKEFHEEGNLAILRYLGTRLSTAISERNPFAIRNTDPDHLRDEEFQLAAFRYREGKILYSLTQRMRALIKNGYSAYDAGLRCQNHMLNLANAFVERIILEQFLAVSRNIDNEALQQVVKRLSDLFALHTIETHRGWYLEQEYLAPVKAKAIRREVDALCASLRQDAAALVDAFAIPDELLAAEIVVARPKN
ncbi:acyl-CoA dehydrogenase family protein [Flavilitoribacter nigricans]|uniref:acyl-CoA oxidase n=1 Tax=Flavilitoribacter nigricans (strain ATCC 23147 / DSM 23189 / NBRC 102662 / NCIMB 1420 / SS-2) TaxID=1122177 RepID=A0A2D0N125_FLAN2|nr:acyl-CoA dehydrogenase [Flavilitoribacter nigricans]PHN01413.1 acyl-CoA oxidase [Flavilitoribacter nigricans DSM 23189 = NBRC 102662]